MNYYNTFLLKGYILLVFFLLPFFAFAQKKIITLKSNGKIVLKNYKVEAVEDEREEKNNIGFITSPVSKKMVPLDLKDGAISAIDNFIKNNTQVVQNTDAIILKINTLSIHEKKEGSGERTTLDAKYTFYINGEKLIDYSGSSYVQSTGDASPYIAKMISQSIEGVLHQFDEWYGENKLKYYESKKFLVKVVLQKNTDDDDKIVFSKNSVLQIEDFTGRPDDLSDGAAATYSGFTVSYEMNNKAGPTIATVDVTPFMQRSQSWMKKEGKSPYVLRHEQIHFNITGYLTCQFIKAVETFPFTQENFKTEMNQLQKKYVTIISNTQHLYDDETQHGQDIAKQKEWDNKIEQELKAVTCYE